MEDTLTYAGAHPDEVRTTLTEFLDMDAALAEKVALETFTTEPNRGALETLADLAVQDGLLEEKPDLDALLD
ncbi:hypothetical protein [Haloechinothrix alba]|nr:hypothetical protein [Haloechinothrix alba]